MSNSRSSSYSRRSSISPNPIPGNPSWRKRTLSSASASPPSISASHVFGEPGMKGDEGRVKKRLIPGLRRMASGSRGGQSGGEGRAGDRQDRGHEEISNATTIRSNITSNATPHVDAASSASTSAVPADTPPVKSTNMSTETDRPSSSKPTQDTVAFPTTLTSEPTTAESRDRAGAGPLAGSTSASAPTPPRTDHADAKPAKSWFASLGRSSTKANKDTPPAPVPATSNPESEPAPAPDSQPQVNVHPPTPPVPPSSPPQPIPSRSPGKRSWFSRSPSPEHEADPDTSGALRPVPMPMPMMVERTMTGMSVDDEVPHLGHTPPSPLSPTAPRERKSSIVPVPVPVGGGTGGLNPSNGRFMLSLPLLGRPKVPLERAVREAEMMGREGEPSPVPAPESPASPDLVSPDSPAPLSPPTASPEPKLTTNSNTSGTWWDYISWTSRAPADEHASAKSKVDGEEADDAPKIKTSASMPDLTAAVSPPKPDAPADDSNKGASAEQLSPPDAGVRAKSVLSEGASMAPSAWYAPWTWYAPAATEEGVPAEEKQVEAAAEGMTASERVREEALARPDPESESPASPTSAKSAASPPSAAPGREGQVSDVLGVSSHRSSWAAFFSGNRSLATKVIGEGEPVKRDADGNEVMDIDESDAEDGVNAQDDGKGAKDDGKGAKVVKSPNGDPKNGKGDPKANRENKPNKEPAADPLTKDEQPKKDVRDANARRKDAAPSPPSSSKPASLKDKKDAPPNLVLPTWADTFLSPPRSVLPTAPVSATARIAKTVRWLLDADGAKAKGKGRAQGGWDAFGKELPRALEVMGQEGKGRDGRRRGGGERVVVIGIHGWFPGTVIRTIAGEPTGTSSKFVNMTIQALEAFQSEHGVKFEKITGIPLEGEGTIDRRVEKLHKNLLANEDWMADLHAADVVFVSTHSQGSVVSTHLIDRLLREGHLRTARSDTVLAESLAAGPVGAINVPQAKPQRLCCLALCGIHLGPLRTLKQSTFYGYIQYLESSAASELFEFQNTDSEVSKAYARALRNVVDNGTKMVYVASLNDQVVPVFSGIFTAANHPLILRALYIDGDAYHSSDFISNLTVLLLRIRNAGLSDSGLLAHLSEATAGSLTGVGHSSAYEELSTYSLAVNYLFLTNDGLENHPELVVEPFDANAALNDYEIPWALRDVIADERVTYFFSQEIAELRDAFRDWHPKTTALKDIKRKLQPIQRLPSTMRAGSPSSVSKL